MASTPFRTSMATEQFYQALDPGIRFAVRILHAAGIEICQSCESGDGHCYPEPTIDLPRGASDNSGFAALHALAQYGLNVTSIAIVWNVADNIPFETIWRVELTRAHPERADEHPMFVHGYKAS